MYYSLEGYRSTHSDPICITPLSRVQNTMVYHSGNRGFQLWVKWLSSFIGKMILVFLLKRRWYRGGERRSLLSALTPQWITFTSKSLKLWPLLLLFFLFHLFLFGCWSLYLGCWTVSIPTARAKHKLACRPLWGSGWHRCACRAPWCCTTGYCWWGCWASHTGNRGSGVFCRLSIQPSPCPTEKTELWIFNLRSSSLWWGCSNRGRWWW